MKKSYLEHPSIAKIWEISVVFPVFLVVQDLFHRSFPEVNVPMLGPTDMSQHCDFNMLQNIQEHGVQSTFVIELRLGQTSPGP